MKLRIQDDTLRLRLTRSEVRQLEVGGSVAAAMAVAPGSALVYTVCAGEGGGLAVALDGGAVTVAVPRGWLAGWADDQRVGFDGTQDAGLGRTLAITVEKDFDCLHRRPEDVDTFPHPDA